MRTSIMEVLSGLLVVAFGFFLIGLAVLIAIKPQLAERFLRSFASSARAHYSEQALRLIAGGAMVIFAPSIRLYPSCELVEPFQVDAHRPAIWRSDGEPDLRAR